MGGGNGRWFEVGGGFVGRLQGKGRIARDRTRPPRLGIQRVDSAVEDDMYRLRGFEGSRIDLEAERSSFTQSSG